MRKEEYLRIVTEQMRCKRAIEAVRKEIQDHIEDQADAFIAEGMKREEAEEAAVREMGDPVETGNGLDRIHRPKMDWRTIGLIGVLGIAGLALQWMMQNYFGSGEAEIQMGKQTGILLLSFGLMIGVCYWDYSRIACRSGICMALLLLFLILGNRFFGVQINGANYWISFGRISINMRQLLLLLVPLYGGLLYSWRGQGYRAVVKAVLWMLPGVAFAFCMPSILTAILLFFSFAVLLTLAVAKGWFRVAKKPLLAGIWGVILLIPFIGTGAVMLWGASYQKARLFAPWGESYQSQMVRELLGGSRWFGAGQRPAADQMFYLSEYTLAYAASYYGILAVILLTALIGFLFLRFLRISLRQKNGLEMIMGTGCSTVLLLQFLFYLADNLAGFPVGGSYCPFLTYGGTGMVVTYILLGILLSIYRYENVITESSTNLFYKTYTL